MWTCSLCTILLLHAWSLGAEVRRPQVREGSWELPQLRERSWEPPQPRERSWEPPQLRKRSWEPPQLRKGSWEPRQLKTASWEPPQLRKGSWEPPQLRDWSWESPHLRKGSWESPQLRKGSWEPPQLRKGSWEPAQLQVGIIGGEDAAPGEFPHQVSVQKERVLGPVHVCGGTIITDEYVLTAAHCVSGDEPSTVRVVAGITDLKDPGGQVLHARILIPHEAYNSVTIANDILLIKLEGKLVFGELVNPLPLPPEGETVPEDTVCTVIGWGATIHNGDTNDKLKKVDVAVVSDETCRMSYGEAAVEASMMCAGWSDGHGDACQGDRGGPLLCLGRLHGVSSWGRDCGDPFYPGVYTEVAYFTDWITIHTSPHTP